MILFIIGFILILPIIAIIDLIRINLDSSQKLLWIIIILFLPILGSVLYFLMGRNQPPRRY
jgi:hypothetical protein